MPTLDRKRTAILHPRCLPQLVPPCFVFVDHSQEIMILHKLSPKDGEVKTSRGSPVCKTLRVGMRVMTCIFPDTFVFVTEHLNLMSVAGLLYLELVAT